MSVFEWAGTRLILVILILALFLLGLYEAAGWIVSYWKPEMAGSVALRLAISVLLPVLLLLIFYDILPGIYDAQEEDILQELIIHEHPDIFRWTLMAGCLILFSVGILCNLPWPFLLGLVTGGCVVWLYLVDVVVAIFVHGMEGVEDIWNASLSGNILGMQGLGILILACTAFFYGIHRHETQTIPVSPSKTEAAKTEEQKKGRLERLYGEAAKFWKEVESAFSSEDKGKEKENGSSNPDNPKNKTDSHKSANPDSTKDNINSSNPANPHGNKDKIEPPKPANLQDKTGSGKPQDQQEPKTIFPDSSNETNEMISRVQNRLREFMKQSKSLDELEKKVREWCEATKSGQEKDYLERLLKLIQESKEQKEGQEF